MDGSPYSIPVPEGCVRLVSACLSSHFDLPIPAIHISGTLNSMLAVDYGDGHSSMQTHSLMVRERTERCVTLSEISAQVLAEVVRYLLAEYRKDGGPSGEEDGLCGEGYSPEPDCVMETMVAAAYLDLPALISICAELIAEHFETLDTFGDLPEALVRAILAHLPTPALCRAEMIMRRSKRKLATGDLWYKKCEDLGLTKDGYPPTSREARRWCIRQHLEHLVGSADYNDIDDVEQVLEAFQFLGGMLHSFKFKTAAIRDADLLNTLVALLPNLQALDSSRAGIGHHGALALSRALAGKFLFSSLNLERNGIGPEGVRFLATAMTSPERVRQLAVAEALQDQERKVLATTASPRRGAAPNTSTSSGIGIGDGTPGRRQTLGLVSHRAPSKELDPPLSSPRRLGNPHDPLLAVHRQRSHQQPQLPQEEQQQVPRGSRGDDVTMYSVGNQSHYGPGMDIRDTGPRPLGHIRTSSDGSGVPSPREQHLPVGAGAAASQFQARISRYSTLSRPINPSGTAALSPRRKPVPSTGPGSSHPSKPRSRTSSQSTRDTSIGVIPEMRVDCNDQQHTHTQPRYLPQTSPHIRPTQLLALDLSSNSVGDAALATLASSLTGSASLTSLNLSHNPLGEAGGLALAELVRHQSQLQTLLCNHAELGTTALTAIIDVVCQDNNMLHLELSSNTGTVARGRGAAGVGTVTTLTQAVSQLIRCNKVLQSLALGYTPFGNNGAIKLGAALKHNDTLTSLSLQAININEEGALSLAKGIAHGAHALTTVDVSWNMLDNGAVATLAAALARSQTLTSMDMGYNACCPTDAAAMARALDVNQRVTSLNLQHPTEDPSWLYDDTRMTNDGCIILAKALPSAPCLAYINLSNHAIRCSGFITLARYMQQSALRTVIVKDNLIALEGAQYLCKVVRALLPQTTAESSVVDGAADRAHARTLFVALDGNPLSPAGVHALEDCMTHYLHFTCTLLQCDGGELVV